MNKKNILLAAILASLAAPAIANGEFEADAADKDEGDEWREESAD